MLSSGVNPAQLIVFWSISVNETHTLINAEEKKKKKKKKSKTKKENSQQAAVDTKDLNMDTTTDLASRPKRHRTTSESSEMEASEAQWQSSKRDKKRTDRTESSGPGESRPGKRKRSHSGDVEVSFEKVKRTTQKDNVHSAGEESREGPEDSKGKTGLFLFLFN